MVAMSIFQSTRIPSLYLKFIDVNDHMLIGNIILLLSDFFQKNSNTLEKFKKKQRDLRG